LAAVGYLSPVARRRIAAVLLVLGAVVAALAIANVGPFSNPPTEADRAQAALEDFFAAARAKDYRGVCKLMTAAERGQIEIKATAIVGTHTGCANVLNSALGLALAKTKVEVQDVRVSGDLAAVDAKLRTPGAARAQYRTYKLQEFGGQWKISEVSL
jgi:ketosteroid isomerase-like protein